MIAPPRIVDAGDDETAIECDLLRAGRAVKLSPSERKRIWSGVSALLPPVIPPVSSPPAESAAAGSMAAQVAVRGAQVTKAAGAATATAAALVKGAVVAIVLAGGAVVAYRATLPVESPRATGAPEVAKAVPSKAPVSAPASSLAPVPAHVPANARVPVSAREGVAAPVPLNAPARARRDIPGEAPPRRLPASRLAAEGQLVLAARNELREGHAAAALMRLETQREAFANGALVQEREAMTIEALQRTGRSEEARRRAEAFVRAYPSSPHVATVKQFAAP